MRSYYSVTKEGKQVGNQVQQGESTAPAGAGTVNSIGSAWSLCVDLQKPSLAKRILFNQFSSLLSLGHETCPASLSHFHFLVLVFRGCGKFTEKVQKRFCKRKLRSSSIFLLKRRQITLNVDFYFLDSRKKLKNLLKGPSIFEGLLSPLQNPILFHTLQRRCLVKGNPASCWSPY